MNGGNRTRGVAGEGLRTVVDLLGALGGREVVGHDEALTMRVRIGHIEELVA